MYKDGTALDFACQVPPIWVNEGVQTPRHNGKRDVSEPIHDGEEFPSRPRIEVRSSGDPVVGIDGDGDGDAGNAGTRG